MSALAGLMGGGFGLHESAVASVRIGQLFPARCQPEILCEVGDQCVHLIRGQSNAITLHLRHRGAPIVLALALIGHRFQRVTRCAALDKEGLCRTVRQRGDAILRVDPRC